MENERRKPIGVGDKVTVPAIPGHISGLVSYGTVTALVPPYAKVSMAYGNMRGTWEGLISQMSRRARYKSERRTGS